MITDDDLIELVRRAGNEGPDTPLDPERIREARAGQRSARLTAAWSGAALVAVIVATAAVVTTSHSGTPIGALTSTGQPSPHAATRDADCECPPAPPPFTVRLNGGTPPVGTPRVVKAHAGRPVTLTLTLVNPAETRSRVDSLVLVAGTPRHGGVALSASNRLAANRALVYRGPATDGRQVTASFSFREPGRYPVTVIVRSAFPGLDHVAPVHQTQRVGTVVVHG